MTEHAYDITVPEDVREMHERYWVHGLTFRELADESGVSHESVRKLFLKYDLPIRDREAARRLRRERTLRRARSLADTLREQTGEGLSPSELAKKHKLTVEAVRAVIHPSS